MTLPQLRDVVDGVVPNAIMPLFWQKGGPVETIVEEAHRIADAGIGAVILEARPHPEFLGDGWWRDVDAVLEVARERGLRVWFFDDDTFPTGHAAGALEGAPAERRRRFLAERHTDAVGPARGASFIVDRRKFFGPDAGWDPGQLVRVVAYRREEGGEALIGEPIDLTERIADGRVFWDVPEGHWRVFFVSVVSDGASERHRDHLSYIDADATRLLLDTVHEAIHARYADDFGGVIAGFFTDEPGFYNDRETFDFTSTVGKPGVVLPWHPDLGLDPLAAPLLWWDGDGATRTRLAYMDALTRLYERSFARPVAEWCRAHGVEHIGHVVEDNGAHMRLGPGAGHYFRAMAGQDMAGVDVIGAQVVPGFGRGPLANMAGAGDGEFFQFGLAKLASSAAHIDPLKRGRSMCEAFGAYGWSFGLRHQAWVTSHLLVRGVTHIVPHAYSPAEYPDLDCPPHFFARGRNPQYRHQAVLSAYTNRVSHLLSGGRHIAPAAVLYPAEADWLGRAMPAERPVRLLAEAQIDADIVPADALHDAVVADGALRVHEEAYDVLVVPGSALLPDSTARTLQRLAQDGLPVLFVDEVPAVADGDTRLLQSAFAPVAQAGLAAAVAERTARAVRVAAPAPELRVHRVDQGAADVVMLMNEGVRATLPVRVAVPRGGEAVSVDPWTGTLRAVAHEGGADEVAIDVTLAPGETALLIVGDPAAWAGMPVAPLRERATPSPVPGPWRIETASALAYPAFEAWRSIDDLVPLDRPGLLPRFSGTIRYTTRVLGHAPSAPAVIDLGEAHEVAQVFVNGADLGVRVAPPYRYDVPAGVLTGDDELVVEVVNTLAKEQPDFFSAWAAQEPTGLLGPVVIEGAR
ncbi:hypothetical protein [Microbacterium sp. KNMS]